MSRISGLISRELQSLPGIIDVGAHVGRAIQGDQAVNVNSAELWVGIDPAADYDATVASVQKVVNAYPGLHHTVQTYLNERSSRILAKADNGLVVRVFGDTTDVLRKTAENVKQTITGINGIVDASFSLPVQQPTLEVEVNLDAAQRYGLKPGDVRRAAATLLSGTQVGNLFQDQKVFDVVVWGTPETRNSLNSIHDLLIDTPNGEQVRLGDVAQVRMAPSESVVHHDAVKRYLDVRVNVQGHDLSAVAVDINSRLQQMSFPLEYHAEVLGGYAEQQAAQNRLLILVIAAAIGMFFLLQAAFGSWRLAAVSFVTLPSALVGGVIAALLGGGVLSLGMLGGLLAVFGIAVRNGILLITHYQHLERYEGETFGPALVLRGSRERLAPIVTTAVVTALVLLPFIVFGNSPGLEIVAPMALVILGGLITSTLLSLFVAPVVYLQFGSSPAPEMLGAELAYQPSLGLAYAGHPHGITAQIDGESTDGALRERAIGD